MTVYYDGGVGQSSGSIYATDRLLSTGLVLRVPTDYATLTLALASASTGDTIVLEPSHADVPSNLTVSQNNLTIVGAGTGTQKPTITAATGAYSTLLTLSGNNILIDNISFLPSTYTTPNLISVAGSVAEIRNCSFTYDATYTASSGVMVGIVNPKKAIIRNTTFTQTAITTTAARAISQLLGPTYVLEDCTFDLCQASFAAGVSILATGLKLLNGSVFNTTQATRTAVCLIVDTSSGSNP
jgi:hypothetical protein